MNQALSICNHAVELHPAPIILRSISQHYNNNYCEAWNKYEGQHSACGQVWLRQLDNWPGRKKIYRLSLLHRKATKHCLGYGRNSFWMSSQRSWATLIKQHTVSARWSLVINHRIHVMHIYIRFVRKFSPLFFELWAVIPVSQKLTSQYWSSSC